MRHGPRPRFVLGLHAIIAGSIAFGTVSLPGTAVAAAATTGDKPADKKKGSVDPSASSSVSLPIQTFSLDNGLRVYVLEDHSTPAFALNLTFDVGSRHEPPGRTGFAHFFEHMMFKGSKNVPDGGHFKYVLGVGGQMNASTSYDLTQYFDVLPSHYLDMALWLEADRLRSLEISDDNFENQRNAVKEEKGMRDNAPYGKAFEDFLSTVWLETGYGHPVIGSTEDLDAARSDDARSFFKEYYKPNNAVMVLVGDVHLDEVRQKVQQYFGDLPRGTERPEAPSFEIKRDKPLEVRTEDPLARTPAYVIGWRTVKEGHPDSYALELLGNVLARGESSRIGKILKDERQLVLAAQYFPFTLRNAGLFASLYIPVQGADFGEIKGVVRNEVARVVRSGIGKADLDKAINQKVMDTMASLSTNLGRSVSIAQGALFHDDPKKVLTDLEKFKAVTRKDIKRVAKEYLTDNWIVLEIVPKG